MVIGKIKPSATLVAQFPAGVEVEAIQHEGRIFMPVVSMGEFAVAGDDTSSSSVRKSEPSAPAAKTDVPAPKSEPATSSATKYTEDELADMDTKDLLKMCKEMGIDPDATDGKNTNKKLRKLILEAQKNGVKSAPSADKESEDDNEESNDDLTSQVSEILEDFDAGKKNKKKTVAALVALVDDADEDKVTELVEAFEDDADADIDETAESIAQALAPKSEKEEKKSPKKGKSKKDEDILVDVDDLEVGDRVSVFWDDDNQDWFDGEVKSIKKGKVVIAYDDDTEEPIDPEVHTKIKKLAE